jgi:hypothetical protein
MSDQEQPSTALVFPARQKRQFSLVPTTFAEAKEMAALIANSDFAPKDYRGKPESVLIAVQMGADLGLSPMQALQNIAVINGRPSIWGDAALALCMPALTMFEETFEGKEGEDGYTAVCKAQRKGWPSPTVRKFSVHDAKVAKLWGKVGSSGGPTPWVTYPNRMLQLRARGFCLRDCGADLLMGLVLAEEAGDYESPIEVQGTAVAIDPLESVDAELRESIRKGFDACEMTPGQRTVKINEYLAGAATGAMTPSAIASSAAKLLEWLKDEYSRKKTGQSRAPKTDNKKEPPAQSSTTSPTASGVAQPSTTSSAASQPNAGASVAGTGQQPTPPAGDKPAEPLTAKDIDFGGRSAPLPPGEIF